MTLKHSIKIRKSPRVALIDGDIIVYRIGFSVEKDIYHLISSKKEILLEGKREFNKYLKKNDLKEELQVYWFETISEPIQNALHSINLLMDDILDQTESGSYKVFLTGDNNFREEVAVTAPYKGTRTGRKPVYYEQIREWLINTKGAVVTDGIEADDKLGIEQSKAGVDTVIASLDKDLDMIPGWHYNWVKEKMYHVNELEGTRNFYAQMLTGDTVDNIIGLKGIGPKKSEKLLKDCKDAIEMHMIVEDEYMEEFKNNWSQRFVENYRLLWMLKEEL